jgi:hypothetical protein
MINNKKNPFILILIGKFCVLFFVINDDSRNYRKYDHTELRQYQKRDTLNFPSLINN